MAKAGRKVTASSWSKMDEDSSNHSTDGNSQEDPLPQEKAEIPQQTLISRVTQEPLTDAEDIYQNASMNSFSNQALNIIRENPHERRFQAADTIELVAQFGPTPTIFCAENEAVRLHVRPGCLPEGHTAGPITIHTGDRYLVKCGGENLLISEVVDCQPAGMKFNASLYLDFCVGESLKQHDEGYDESHGNEELENEDHDAQQRDEYMDNLRECYKVLWREDSNAPWSLLPESSTRIFFEGNRFFIRGYVNHFSQGCLAKSIQVDSPYHDEVVSSFWKSPKTGELEFVNATSRPLAFLILPTSCSNKAFCDLDAGFTFLDSGVNMAVNRAIHQTVFSSTTSPQVVEIGRRTAEGAPRPGERCPYVTFSLPPQTGSVVGVSLMTGDGTLISVWDYRIVKQRTRVTVLPGRFGEGMSPQLGEHSTDGLDQQGGNSRVRAALSAVKQHLSWSQQQELAPASTISS